MKKNKINNYFARFILHEATLFYYYFPIKKKHASVEEKQKEIIDSIKYGRRIQQALIPTGKTVGKILWRLQK